MRWRSPFTSGTSPGHMSFTATIAVLRRPAPEQVVLINFLYVTCGDICPLMTANLVQVQAALGERLGREVFMYSITLDPQADTPEALKQYAAGYGVKPGWYFLTGQDEEIQRLRRTLGLYDRDPRIDADKTQHTGLFIYGNEATGRWGQSLRCWRQSASCERCSE